MPDHALLGPSSASIWMTCTPAPRLWEKLPKESSSYADEGTLAHALGALIILRRLYRVRKANYMEQLADIQKSGYYNKAMLRHCQNYAAYVLSIYAKARTISADAQIYIETRVILSEWIPESFGTADVLIVCEGALWLIDLKYGEGVPVSAQENKQLMIYALGALYIFDGLICSTIHTVSLTIYQPRLDSVDTYATTAPDLYTWANSTLREQAKKAWKGSGEFAPGKHCQFCAVRLHGCRAQKEYHMELAKDVKWDKNEQPLLSDEEVSEVILKYDTLLSWAKAVKEMALKKALAGKKWPGLKLVAGRSNRTIKDPLKALRILQKAGYKMEEIATLPTLKGITELEHIVGDSDLAHHLKDLITKPYGAPVLAPEKDKRRAYNKAEAAKSIFKPQLYE